MRTVQMGGLSWTVENGPTPQYKRIGALIHKERMSERWHGYAPGDVHAWAKDPDAVAEQLVSKARGIRGEIDEFLKEEPNG